MKKLITLLLLLIACNAIAQINLEHTYANRTSLKRVLIDGIGDKYAMLDNSTKTVEIYNLDHTLLQSINLDIPTTALVGSAPLFLSNKLFDNDNGIEFVILYSNISSVTLAIIDENGKVMLQVDNAEYPDLEKINGSYKLFVKSGADSRIYSLPGQYNGLKKVNEADNTASTELYPNPMDNAATIEYKLPHGVNSAVLKVYNAQGVQMRQYNVTNQFQNILIQRGELPAGNYTYEMNAANMSKVSRQFVVQ